MEAAQTLEGLALSTQVRPLTADDYGAYARIASYAFNCLPAQIMDELARGAPTLGVFAEGQLAAALLDRRFDLNVNGTMVRANGIGMVASAPETRRRGMVRELFAAHLEQLRDDGVVLSLLYPFNFGYYNRFGWGFGERRLKLFVPPREFAGYGRPVGRVREILYVEKDVLKPADGETLDSVIETLDRLYRAEAARWNLSAQRSRADWQRMLEVHRGRRFVFVWEPEGGGEAQGYFIGYFREERHDGDLTCRQIIAATPDAWRGLCDFLRSHDSQNKHIVFDVPFEHRLLDLLDNPRVDNKALEHGPMVRAVDLVGLLEARGVDGICSGRCVLEVADGLAPWNDGRFSVTMANGRLTAERSEAAEGAAEADLSGPIDVISQLAVGVRSVDDMMRFGFAQGRPGRGLDFARGLFAPRPIWHNEYY